jgi:hypothetical protein
LHRYFLGSRFSTPPNRGSAWRGCIFKKTK